VRACRLTCTDEVSAGTTWPWCSAGT
jgi:hypothetical protein